MTDRELMQMALDALEKLNKDGWILADFEDEVCASIEALRTALAQPEQEPVAWIHTTATGDVYFRKKPHDKVFNPQPVYTAPPQREWQGLTDEEIHSTDRYEEDRKLYCFARAIEAKLKEKNT